MESGANHQIPNAPKTNLDREIILMVLQFLRETSRMESAHRLEMETGVFLDVQYLEDLIMKGDWYLADEYLKAFTNAEEEQASTRIFFEIRKQQYYEALNRNDKSRAFQILQTDLDEFRNFSVYNELLQCLTCRSLTDKVPYESDEINRRKLLIEVKGLLQKHSRLKHILKLPSFPKDFLRTNIFQSVQFTHLINCTDFLTTRQSLVFPITDITSVTENHHCEKYMVEGPTPMEESLIEKRKASTDGETDTKRTKIYSVNELPTWYATSLATESQPTVVLFSPVNSNILFAGQENGDISVFDVSEGDAIMSVKATSAGSVGSVRLLSISPDGGHIAFVTDDRDTIFVFLVFVSNRTSQHLFKLNHKAVNSLQFIVVKEKLCLLSVSDHGDILVWDMETEKVDIKWESEKPTFGIVAGIFDETAFAASVVEDKSIGVWLFNNAKQIQSLPTEHIISKLSICQNKLITCGPQKNSLLQWDIQFGQATKKYEGYSGNETVVPCVDFIQDNFITVSENKELKFWYLEDEKLVKTVKLDMDTNSISVNKSGSLLAVSPKSSYTNIKIYGNAVGISNIRNRKEPATVPQAQRWTPNKSSTPRTPPSAVVTASSTPLNSNPEKRFVLATKSNKKTSTEASPDARITPVPSPIKITPARVTNLMTHKRPIRNLLFNSTSQALFAVDGAGEIMSFKYLVEQQLPTYYPIAGPQQNFGVGSNPCYNLALTKLDTYLACSTGAGISLTKVAVLETTRNLFYLPDKNTLETEKLDEFVPKPNHLQVTSFYFAMPDNNHFICGTSDSDIRILCVKNKQILKIIKVHKSAITSLTQWDQYIISADKSGKLNVNKVDISSSPHLATESVYYTSPVGSAVGLVDAPILGVSVNRIKGTAIVVQKKQLSIINVKNAGLLKKLSGEDFKFAVQASFAVSVPVRVAQKERDNIVAQAGEIVTVVDRVRDEWKVIHNKKILFFHDEAFATIPANEDEFYVVRENDVVERHKPLGTVVKSVQLDTTIYSIAAHTTNPLNCVVGTANGIKILDF